MPTTCIAYETLDSLQLLELWRVDDGAYRVVVDGHAVSERMTLADALRVFDWWREGCPC
jgi:hypothetical protein